MLMCWSSPSVSHMHSMLEDNLRCTRYHFLSDAFYTTTIILLYIKRLGSSRTGHVAIRFCPQQIVVLRLSKAPVHACACSFMTIPYIVCYEQRALWPYTVRYQQRAFEAAVTGASSASKLSFGCSRNTKLINRKYSRRGPHRWVGKPSSMQCIILQLQHFLPLC